MGKRIHFIQYKGREIVFADYSNIKSEDEYLKVLDESERESFQHNPSPQDNLTLIDVTESIMSANIVSRSSKLNAKIGGKNLLVAIVGISRFKRVIANAFSKKFYFADTLEEAKGWLVKKGNERDGGKKKDKIN